MSKKMLIVSDLHVGSIYGLMPQKFVSQNGSVYLCSPAQRVLLNEWQAMAERVGKVDDLIVNGDLVDGTNRKAEGAGLWTSDLNNQVEAAAGLVSMVNASRIHISYGSVYHTKENPIMDALVAQRLSESGRDVKHGYELAINYQDEKKNYHFLHHIGVSAVFHYRSTPIARELMTAVLHEKQLGQYTGIVRSHAHYFCYLEFGHSFGLITPGWKLRDAFGTRKGFGIVPRCGWVLLHIDKDGGKMEKHIFSPSIESTLVRSVV